MYYHYIIKYKIQNTKYINFFLLEKIFKIEIYRKKKKIICNIFI